MRRESILTEYDAHIDELLASFDKLEDESQMRDRSYFKVREPEEIASMWREELSVTPSNMKWLFIAVNVLFFGGGSLLHVAHNLFDWRWLTIYGTS